MFFKLPEWVHSEIRGYRGRAEEKLLVLREWLNRNPRIVVGVSIACLVVFLAVLIVQLLPERPERSEKYDKEWFYDLNTGKLFSAKEGLVPPIDAPSGRLPNGEAAGVRAFVFSYVSEPNESECFIGFLEKPDGKT